MAVSAPRIDDAAADWAARLDRAPLAPDEAARLEAWLAEDPRHQGAFARARAVLTYFDKAKALGEDFDAEAFAEPPPSRRAVWAAAAGLAVVAGGGLVAYRAMAGGYRTRRGEMRRVPLPDGSSVTLNTASKINVDYGKGARAVRLAGGEALFTVRRDGGRPFVVQAGDVTVRAAHADFTVRRRASAVEVMVCDGWVELVREGRVVQRISTGAVALAGAGAAPKVTPVAADEVNRRLAWREGMIAFHGETLAQAAAEFARYAGPPIVIDDPDVADRKVVGLFTANDPANFAKAVAASFGLTAEPAPGGGVRLTE